MPAVGNPYEYGGTAWETWAKGGMPIFVFIMPSFSTPKWMIYEWVIKLDYIHDAGSCAGYENQYE